MSDKELWRSKVVAGVAFCLWLTSLFLVGFVDQGARPWSGLSILAQGWLGLVVICAAWYANPLFLVSLLILATSDKAPRILAVIAVLLSLDTFRFADMPSNPNVPTIYAYGAGAVLWFAAMFTAMIAAGLREVELREGGLTLGKFLTDPIAVFGSLTLFIGAVLVLHWIDDDRRDASETELRYLSLAPIKRGPVCKEHIADPQKTMLLDGPLELRGEGYPLTSPNRLLALGIPVVRSDGYDYSLANKDDLGSVVVTPSIGESSAILKVEEKSSSWIKAKLQNARDGSTLFEQWWVQGGRTGHNYCPDLDSRSMSAKDQPWRLIAQALGGMKTFHPPANMSRSDTFGDSKTWLSAVSVSVQASPVADSARSNLSCLPEKGVIAENELPTKARSDFPSGNGFHIGNKVFLSGLAKEIRATCHGNDIYLFKSWENSGGESFIVYLQSRSATDFGPGTTRTFSVPYRGKMHLEGGVPTLDLRRIVDPGNPLIIEVINTYSGELLTVTANFPK